MNIFISPAVAVWTPVVFLAVVTPLIDIRRIADRTMYVGKLLYSSVVIEYIYFNRKKRLRAGCMNDT